MNIQSPCAACHIPNRNAAKTVNHKVCHTDEVLSATENAISEKDLPQLRKPTTSNLMEQMSTTLQRYIRVAVSPLRAIKSSLTHLLSIIH